MTHAHEHAGVCLCGDDEGAECNCSHSKEAKQQVSHCGSDGGECHCHDEKPQETEEMVAMQHGHHSHAPKSFLQTIRPYSRLITTIVVVLAFGIILSLLVGFSWLSAMEYWMGGYFVAFGVQQALSLKKSAAMFRQYDPLAKRVPVYGYALPFIQIALGIAYFFMVWWAAVGIVAFAILLTNAIGVYKVIQREQVVRCGCLGEGMNVPVSQVTLWENLIMLGMVAMMLTYHAFSLLTTGGTDMTSMPGMKM